ncbi:MAG: ABC transporter ATP-binding protein [Deltaproteobacteria bacterium]|jgi:sulfate transport system ATP-binding protein|nr:ABC transporter ATP-binding protein [Deltaproteobacteria bacterium]
MYVELNNVSKNFGHFQAVRNVSFGLEKGVLGALLGPSGSGKTTILRMIAGLENPDSGDIFLDQLRVNDIEPSRRGLGFVFQNYALFRYMTVFDNIAFGLKTQKVPRDQIRQRVEELTALIGMEGLESRYPAQLSGGQRQRVAFARALAPNPRILLLDEPFAAIDAKVRRELRSWLRGMISQLKITSIFVTHDQAEAIEVADQIIVANLGRVEQAGTPLELYRSPATPFVARFLGDSTVIGDYRVLAGFENAPEGAECAIRPEFIRIYDLQEPIQYENSVEDGEVVSLAFRGDSIETGVNVRGFVLTAFRSLEKRPLAVGQKVKVLIYRLYAFDREQALLIGNNRLDDVADGYRIGI